MRKRSSNRGCADTATSPAAHTPGTLVRPAASVSTRVVSWNDAALMNDCVVSDAFVMPSSSGSERAGVLPFAISC